MASNNGMSLTQVAEVARKAIYFIAIGFVVLAITTYILRQAQDYQRLHPPQVKELPNYLFGKLPNIHFPDGGLPKKVIKLELSSGFFPTSPATVKVLNYKIAKTPGFDPVQKARTFAAANGFSAGEVKISDEEYSFLNSINRLKKMTINVTNQNFQITSDLKTDYSLLTAYDLPDPQTAIQFANQFLSQNSLWQPADLNTQSKILYYKINPEGVLQLTDLPFEANLIKVIFTREKIDDIQAFFDSEEDGDVAFLLSGSQDGNPVIAELKYAYYDVDLVNFGKYYCKTPQEAWTELSSRKAGYVESYGDLPVPVVRSVYLGFYDSLDGKNFLQPVWVFDGDKGFRAYVSAVNPK
jgi:hypothetical protein